MYEISNVSEEESAFFNAVSVPLLQEVRSVYSGKIAIQMFNPYSAQVPLEIY